MAQLSFNQNFPLTPIRFTSINLHTMSFFPFNINDSISLKTVNLIWRGSNTNTLNAQSARLSMGLYSLTGSTLSLANSLELTNINIAAGGGGNSVQTAISISTASATQNITPGTWWWGIIMGSTTSNGLRSFSLLGGFTAGPGNSFPGSFIGGAQTVSTSVLPASVATSDLDVTGLDAMFVPMIILSS